MRDYKQKSRVQIADKIAIGGVCKMDMKTEKARQKKCKKISAQIKMLSMVHFLYKIQLIKHKWNFFMVQLFKNDRNIYMKIDAKLWKWIFFKR